jgi:hypothetical protein
MTANLKRISEADQTSIVAHAEYLLNHLNDL